MLQFATAPAKEATMQHIAISDAARHEGHEVTLRGWLYNLRSSGKILFLLVRDGTGVMQCIVA